MDPNNSSPRSGFQPTVTTAQQLEAIYKNHMLNQLATQEAAFKKREAALQKEIQQLRTSNVPVPL